MSISFCAHIASFLPHLTRPPLHNPTSIAHPFVHRQRQRTMPAPRLTPHRHVQTVPAQCHLHLAPRPSSFTPTAIPQQPLIRPLRRGPRVAAYNAYGGARSNLFLFVASQPFSTFYSLFNSTIVHDSTTATQPFWLSSITTPLWLLGFPCGSACLPLWDSWRVLLRRLCCHTN